MLIRTNTKSQEICVMSVCVQYAYMHLFTYFAYKPNPFPHSSASNPNACRAIGRGLQPKGVRVKEVADFKVYTRGAGSGDLRVLIKNPSKWVLKLHHKTRSSSRLPLISSVFLKLYICYSIKIVFVFTAKRVEMNLWKCVTWAMEYMSVTTTLFFLENTLWSSPGEDTPSHAGENITQP